MTYRVPTHLLAAVDAADDARHAAYDALSNVATREEWHAWRVTADAAHAAYVAACAAVTRAMFDDTYDACDVRRSAVVAVAPVPPSPRIDAATVALVNRARVDAERDAARRRRVSPVVAALVIDARDRMGFAASDWAYVDVEPRETAPAVPMPTVRPRPVVVRDWRARRDSASTLPPYVPSDVFDPSRPTAAVRALETAADALLRAHAAENEYRYLPRPDVFDRWTRRQHVRPDAVAYRGAARWRPPSPVRVFAAYRRDRETGALVPTYALDPVTGAALLHVRHVAASDATTVRGWLGHRRYAMPRRAARARAQGATRARRAAVGATTARGPAVSPLALSDGALRRRWAAVAGAARAGDSAAVARVERAAGIDAALRLVDRDTPVTFDVGNGATVTVTTADGATVTTDNGRTFGIRDYSRRVALL